ncbi:MAG: hypothetical protein LAT82_03415 [Nanoarchaeota archaeon]|nr:hypothetical protein [Nanoarchaeota archaeon]
MSQITSKLYFLPHEHQRSISLKTENGGLWENIDYVEEDSFNISKISLQPQFRDFIYITTLSGFEKASHRPKHPILGIILSKRFVDVMQMDNILGFVMHDVEDVKDYCLNPHRNTQINSRRNFRKELDKSQLQSPSNLENVVNLSTYNSSQNDQFLKQRNRRKTFDLPLTQSFSIPNSRGLDVVMSAEYAPHQDALEMFLSEKGYSFDSFFSVANYK